MRAMAEMFEVFIREWGIDPPSLELIEAELKGIWRDRQLTGLLRPTILTLTEGANILLMEMTAWVVHILRLTEWTNFGRFDEQSAILAEYLASFLAEGVLL